MSFSGAEAGNRPVTTKAAAASGATRAPGRAIKSGDTISGYPGGKSGAGVYQRIINEIPPHDFYLEPFIGGGSVMFYKRRSLRDVGVDINGDTITLARRRLPFAELYEGDGMEYLRLMLGAQIEAKNARQLAERKRADELGQTSSATESGGDGHPRAFLRSLKDPVTGTGGNYSRIVIYADPPYFMPTRRSKARLYSAEPTDQTFDGKDESWHVSLLNILDALECNVLLSGYMSELYEQRLKAPKWRAISYTTMTHGGPAEEWLWCNFPKPRELHDYRYLGHNRRERERIRKKKKRWTEKLRNMPELERLAIMGAIQELDCSKNSAVGNGDTDIGGTDGKPALV